MSTTWLAINDDDLKYVAEAADFLQNEFCATDADPVWSADYFRWKIGQENPAGRGYLSLAMVGDRVVGVTSLTKKRLLIDGKEVIGCEIGDAYSSTRMRRTAQSANLSAVNPDPNNFVNRSIFGRLASDVRARAEADGISFIYGTPNKNSYPGFTKRLDYFALAGYPNQSFSRPTWRMVLKKYQQLAFASGLLRVTENVVIGSHAWLSRKAATGLVFEQFRPSGDEIDELWRRVRPLTGFSLVRDAAYWRHRYDTHPLARYRIFSVRCNGVLVSVVAIRLATVIGGRAVLSIVEWMSAEEVSFGFLLTQIVDACKAWNIDVFNFWADASGAESKAAFLSCFAARGHIPIIFAGSSEGKQFAETVKDFRFSLGSVDAV